MQIILEPQRIQLEGLGLCGGCSWWAGDKDAIGVFREPERLNLQLYVSKGGTLNITAN